MTTENWTNISTKVTKEQQEQLDREAGECGMTRSEYIKARLFIDKEEIKNIIDKKLGSYDRDLISASIKSFVIIQKIYKKFLPEKELDQLLSDSEKLLMARGYKPKEQ